MGSIGGPEILVILVIALLLFGPTKLPELGKSLGRALREFKKASQELQDTIEREVDDLKREAPAPANPVTPRGALPAPQTLAPGEAYPPSGQAPPSETVPATQLPFSESAPDSEKPPTSPEDAR